MLVITLLAAAIIWDGCHYAALLIWYFDYYAYAAISVSFTMMMLPRWLLIMIGHYWLLIQPWWPAGQLGWQATSSLSAGFFNVDWFAVSNGTGQRHVIVPSISLSLTIEADAGRAGWLVSAGQAADAGADDTVDVRQPQAASSEPSEPDATPAADRWWAGAGQLRWGRGLMMALRCHLVISATAATMSRAITMMINVLRYWYCITIHCQLIVIDISLAGQLSRLLTQ